jgi:hypothetical protein
MKTKKLTKTQSVVIAVAAIAGASVGQEAAAARAAMQDMRQDIGDNVFSISYDWNPFDGMLA